MSAAEQELPAPAISSPLRQPLSGRVLVVDDELPNRLYLRKLLKSRDCEVYDADGGAVAFEMALKRQPDLILVDIIMPEMDGFELCRLLRTEPRTAHIPIIMVTAQSKIEDIETGFDLGAMDYIRKPFNPRELMLRVGNALALKRSNDALTIWNKRVARDLELAGAIQRSLFSETPHFSRHFEVRIAYRTCMDVGGDAFDIVSLPDGKHCIYVADVSGHGVAPAMISSMIKATASEMIRRYAGQGPAAVCNALNRVIRRRIDNPSYFATVFMAIHDPDRMEWRCMNCGHPRPILLIRGAVADAPGLQTAGGTPIGFPFGDETPYREIDEIRIPDEGDTCLLLYTDGLTEARHRQTGTECGGLLEAMYRQVLSDPAMPDKAAALLDLMQWNGFRLEEDDCTAISIHMLDPLKVVIEQSVPRNVYLVSEVAKQCETAVTSRGISRDTAGLVRLLVMELGVNLVEHGGLREDESFWLQVRVYDRVCQLVLIDHGAEWDLDQALARKLDDTYMGERGRGLAITNAVSNRIERYRIDAENITYCTIIDQEEA